MDFGTIFICNNSILGNEARLVEFTWNLAFYMLMFMKNLRDSKD